MKLLILGGGLVPMIAFGLIIALAPNPQPPEKKIDAFMGYAVSRFPETCKVEERYVDEGRYAMKTCLLEDGGDQMVFATYLDDEAFPGDRGRLLKAYSILSKSVTGNDAKLNAYLTAFQDKYGTFSNIEAGNLAAPPARVLLCNKGQDCRRISSMHTVGKTYSSSLLNMILRLTGQGSMSFREVSIWDQELMEKVAQAAESKASEDARALVK